MQTVFILPLDIYLFIFTISYCPWNSFKIISTSFESEYLLQAFSHNIQHYKFAAFCLYNVFYFSTYSHPDFLTKSSSLNLFRLLSFDIPVPISDMCAAEDNLLYAVLVCLIVYNSTNVFLPIHTPVS